MFSLADPDSTEGILAASGFAEVGCTEVHAPVCCGLDAATAYDFVLGLRTSRTSSPAWMPPRPRRSGRLCNGYAPSSAGATPAAACCSTPCLDYHRSPPLACRRRPDCESVGKSRSLDMPTEPARRTSERPLACRRGSRLSSCRVGPGTGCGRGREGDPECRERVGGEGVLRGVDHPEVGANVQFGSCDEQFYQGCP